MINVNLGKFFDEKTESFLNKVRAVEFGGFKASITIPQIANMINDLR